MESELEKAFDLIKESCSREEQIKELFSNDKDGSIDLRDLDLKGLDVNLNRLKARRIYNGHQKADIYIYNSFQEAKYIYNNRQTETT